jgi:DNA-binding response OmpR family regulator
MTDTKKVMIVEDDEYISKVYEIKFAKEGIAISIARDGEEAVKKITEEVPDLILLDLMIPKKDGFAVLEEIKKKPKLAKIPVIVLSNLGQATDIERVKKLGANEFLVKVDHPIQDVINKVHGYLKDEKA